MVRKSDRPETPSPRVRAAEDPDFKDRQDDRRRRLGEQVRALREHRKLDQADLAARCGLSRPYIASIELGKTNPTVNTLWALADGLEINPAEFFIEEPLEW